MASVYHRLLIAFEWIFKTVHSYHFKPCLEQMEMVQNYDCCLFFKGQTIPHICIHRTLIAKTWILKYVYRLPAPSVYIEFNIIM